MAAVRGHAAVLLHNIGWVSERVAGQGQASTD